VKEKRVSLVAALISNLFLFLAFAPSILHAQSAGDADAGQKRLKRARALVAAHKLGAAASELEAVRNTTTDDAMRDIARIMLMSIHLEDGDYMRAQSLLEESYKARSPQNENSTRTYFALAGQAVNGSRERLNRYRSFGINIADKELPPEAANDLEHMRMLLERVAQQAREICSQDEKSFDALGLMEEVAGVRGTLARNAQDRLQWQREVASARQKLAASETRIAAGGGALTRTGGTTISPQTSTAASAASSSPNHTTSPISKKEDAPAVNQSTQPKAPNSVPNGSQTENAIQNGQVREVGSLIEKATQKVNPSYPQTAKIARITGVVTIYLEVDENGAVKAVQRTSGPQLLRQAAEDAARRWKFRPTVIDGQPVRVTGFINFNFTL
jgi:TonB family protein